MAERLLMKGNEVIAEAAIRAGCRGYFGYPITPQSEIGNYMAKRMPEVGGAFVQAESEVAAINMVYGAASCGVRTMTSSSSPGFALKQEGISYIAGAELPAVAVNIMRGGPGLGSIQPAQGDYFMNVKTAGHGGARQIVLAPASVQELYELTVSAFNLADKYRVLSVIAADGVLGQMMEVVEFRDNEDILDIPKPWALSGSKMKRPSNIITSVKIIPEHLEEHNNHLAEKYRLISENEPLCQTTSCDDADVIFVAYGTAARIVASVVRQARKDGIKVGLFRPVTLWPFPQKELRSYAAKTKALITVELSQGQMVDDIKLYTECKLPVHFYGRNGGMLPSQEEIYEKMKEILALYV